jgi:hypothetical protein
MKRMRTRFRDQSGMTGGEHLLVIGVLLLVVLAIAATLLGDVKLPTVGLRVPAYVAVMTLAAGGFGWAWKNMLEDARRRTELQIIEILSAGEGNYPEELSKLLKKRGPMFARRVMTDCLHDLFTAGHIKIAPDGRYRVAQAEQPRNAPAELTTGPGTKKGPSRQAARR